MTKTNYIKNQKVGLLISGQFIDGIVLRPGRFRSYCQWKIRLSLDGLGPYNYKTKVRKVWNRRIFDA